MRLRGPINPPSICLAWFRLSGTKINCNLYKIRKIEQWFVAWRTVAKHLYGMQAAPEPGRCASAAHSRSGTILSAHLSSLLLQRAL